MFIDARSVADGEFIECDVCVVGAGAAGIAFAREFIGHAARICVLESGDLELEGATQDLYDGENVGLPYPLYVSRLRFFGGTTNHWAGYCLPFRASDFEAQPWLAHSGWPIGLADVAPYYERAGALLNLPGKDWQVSTWEDEIGASSVPFDPERLRTAIIRINPVRFGEVYRQEVAGADNLWVYLNANVVEVASNETASTVTGLRVRTLAGNGFKMGARFVVLAAGGIENPRLLLLSDRVQKGGLGNQNDLVGRFFLAHPILPAGTIRPASPGVPFWFYALEKFGERGVLPYVLLAKEEQQRQQLVPAALSFRLIPHPSYRSDGLRSFVTVGKSTLRGEWPGDLMEHVGNVMADLDDLAGLAYKRLRYGQVPLERIDFQVTLAPLPRADSRITLGEERDAVGQRRVVMDWRLSRIDKRSARRMAEVIAEEVGRLRLGRVKSAIDDDDSSWPEDMEDANHHLGTTRMSDDPLKGVVDRDCKVHAKTNLYIAGSSVFPTAGTGSPTMLIIALALRLADHIKKQLA